MFGVKIQFEIRFEYNTNFRDLLTINQVCYEALREDY